MWQCLPLAKKQKYIMLAHAQQAMEEDPAALIQPAIDALPVRPIIISLIEIWLYADAKLLLALPQVSQCDDEEEASSSSSGDEYKPACDDGAWEELSTGGCWQSVIACRGTPTEMRRMLSEGADVNATDGEGFGFTAMTFAARSDHPAMMQVLLEGGADSREAGQVQ